MSELNGWKIEDFKEAVRGIEQQPEAGLLRWKSRAIWDGGFGLDVRLEQITQMGEAMTRHFTLRGDHPPELLGENTGATSLETMLAALGSCVTSTFAAQATLRGVKLRSLEVDIEGSIDLNGVFGLGDVRPGLFDARLTLHVDSDAEAKVLQEILEATRSRSPVFDTVTKPVAVRTEVRKVA